MPWRTAAGGPRRQDSVRLGLAALPAACGTVLVHDGARPFLTPALVTRVADALTDSPTIPPADGAALPFGVVPGLPVTDTIKEVDAGNRVRRTPARADLRAAQTPQAFRTAALAEAHRRAEAEGWEVTDDASLMERCGHPVAVVEGDPANRKITLPEDLALLADRDAPRPCSGWGYDVHRYGGSRPLVLGGVSIPGEWTVSAHSDGDVLLHALMDAVFGLPGRGRHRPPVSGRRSALGRRVFLSYAGYGYGYGGRGRAGNLPRGPDRHCSEAPPGPPRRSHPTQRGSA